MVIGISMTTKANNLKALSITCRILIGISIIAGLLEAFHPLISVNDTVSLESDKGVMIFKVGDVPLQTRSLLSLVMLIPFLFWITGLVAVWKMCNHFKHGKIFEVEPMRCFERFGWMIALTGLAQVALSPLISVILNTSSILEGASVAISVDLTNGIEYWVAAIVVALIARILKESIAIAKEVESFV